jgi:hypothetical protein
MLLHCKRGEQMFTTRPNQAFLASRNLTATTEYLCDPAHPTDDRLDLLQDLVEEHGALVTDECYKRAWAEDVYAVTDFDVCQMFCSIPGTCRWIFSMESVMTIQTGYDKRFSFLSGQVVCCAGDHDDYIASVVA